MLLLLAESISRPSSPTTHLQQVYILPLQVKKRKTIKKRIMESFCEHKDLFLAGDNQNNLSHKGYMQNNLEISNLKNNIMKDSKLEQRKLNRRTTSVQKNTMSSFLVKKKRSLLMTSFREMKNNTNLKQVCLFPSLMLFCTIGISSSKSKPYNVY